VAMQDCEFRVWQHLYSLSMGGAQQVQLGRWGEVTSL